LLPEIVRNISKGKKILFLKEREIKTKEIEKTKSFLGLILQSNPQKKQEVLAFIDENTRKITKVPDYLCCKITYVFNNYKKC
jgi:hypothetical protein